MSEWAKMQGCWQSLRARAISYETNLQSCRVLVDVARSEETGARRAKKITDGVVAQSEVVSKGSSFWVGVLSTGIEHGILTHKEHQILKICSQIPRSIPNDHQCSVALQVLNRLQEANLL